ncbi:MAG: amino acid permease [bacterium]|nr:amino acid permease [Candidatus Sumerlaeota bacterium]
MPTAGGETDRTGRSGGKAMRIVVVTTVMLTFISFWRAAAVVLNDLASSAYYAGGIAAESIGKAAPWFILAVMLFSYAVRAVYVESCSMFVRGGVYRIVKEAMGNTMAKISVSALMFDYALTGPISSVSAGQYLHGLFRDTCVHMFHWQPPIAANHFSIIFALAVTVYFWLLNIKGIEESSGKALRIMQVTTVMVALIFVWSLITMYCKQRYQIDGGLQVPPFKPVLGPDAAGWLDNVPWLKNLGIVVFMVGFGHSVLAMSGEETLAQVYREIEAPKHKNLLRTGLLIFLYSMVFTSFVTFAAGLIIPDSIPLKDYKDNLISCLVMQFTGPGALKLLMQAFVVGVGALILSGAVNTSMIGANGVLNRVAEDGVLDDWFRQPHGRFGTTYRIINLIGILQCATIVLSEGDVYILGEAYAFGVVWSFAFMGLAMLMLRWKHKGERGWKVPLNFKIRGIEVPAGLGAIVFVLLMVALTNLVTKKLATISGLSFTAVFFILFTISEWHSHHKRRKAAMAHEHKEKFRLDRKSDVTPEALDLPEGKHRILIPARDPNNLVHLKTALEESHAKGTDVVVMTIKVEKGDQAFQHVFTSDEEKLFTNVVNLAEKYGEALVPIVVSSNNSWFAIARTAYELQCDEVLLGKSERIPPDIQMEQLAIMWAQVAGNKPIMFRIIMGPGKEIRASL